MAFRTSNPSLNEKTFSSYAYLTGADPATLMTVSGTINKASVLVLATVATAAAAWVLAVANPAVAFPLAIAGALGGFITGLVAIFKKETAPITAPIYAIFEGLLLGVISQIFNAALPGIALQAVTITFSILLLMLVLYRAGAVRATPTFTKVIFLATAGIAAVYVVNILLRLGGYSIPFIHESTPVGILFSVGVCIVASLNFVLDFDLIEKGAEQGAPKFMEWYAAFSLLVTLVWLYLEILRLLSKLRR